MTVQEIADAIHAPIDPACAAVVLENTAVAWKSGEIDQDTAATIAHAWVHDDSRAGFWPLFEEYAALVELRDGVNDGRVDWREVDPEITGWDPSTTAYEVACQMAGDAARALLGGQR
ncbi:hypothetical protein OG589_14795 [Sphaerisporangium sp. NBC_01403]|uniref:hypothetical protein n=1 Tax=Sphaerisporangium sp. NBC_01403 TaxID=2903599 RepID=UPI003254C394